MTNSYDKLNLTARFDRRLVGPDGDLRHLVIDVEAPHVPVPDDEARPPLHLGLVIDASGSMSGEPFYAVKAASRGVVEMLRPVDRVTLVTFASDVITHAEAVACDAAGKTRVLDEIDGLVTRGMTNLSGGWTETVEQLRIARTDGVQNRIILLSDGHANAGIVDPESLGLRAAAAGSDGVFTSCVGIGEGYSALQLQALADHGGGRLHHAAKADEIIEVVLGELGEIRKTFAEKVAVTIDIPVATGLSVLGPLPARRENGDFIIDLGVLTSGAVRQVVVKVQLPSSGEHHVHNLAATASWVRPGEAVRTRSDVVSAAVHCAPAAEVASELPAPDVGLAIVKLWQSDIVRRASLRLEEGDREGALGLVNEELPAIKELAADFVEAGPVIHELERFARRLERPVSRHLSKELACMGHKLILCETDCRGDLHDNVSDLLGYD